MNTRLVDSPVIWALLAMEAGLALPLVSLPAQGAAWPGAAGPLLLVLLLPGGHLAVRRFPTLRDPSWRLLVGIGLALLTRALVSPLPAPDPRGLAVWLGSAVFPSALGVTLWWRGSATSVAEMTAAEVRTEFGLLAVCLVAVLALMRPFVVPDPVLLLATVLLFAGGGLLASALARQDAAEVRGRGGNRALAIGTGLLPCLAAALLVGVLRPGLLGTFWLLLSRLIELLLLPLGLLLAWLASLLPQGTTPPIAPVPPPPVQPLPDPRALEQAQDPAPWLASLVLLCLLLVVAIFAMLIARLMLQHWLQPPPPRQELGQAEPSAERTGTAGGDVRAFLGWLWRWLGARLRPARGPAHAAGMDDGSPSALADAWRAYRALLEWAAQHGRARRAAETTRELQSRLVHWAPTAAEDLEVLTSTYESERYGGERPPADRLRRLARAVQSLQQAPPRRGA